MFVLAFFLYTFMKAFFNFHFSGLLTSRVDCKNRNHVSCCMSPWDINVWAHHGCLEKHLPLIHGNLVGAGLRRAKEDNVLVLEGLQRLGLAPLVDGHVLSTHSQPQVVREATLFALHGREGMPKVWWGHYRSLAGFDSTYTHFSYTNKKSSVVNACKFVSVS